MCSDHADDLNAILVKFVIISIEENQSIQLICIESNSDILDSDNHKKKKKTNKIKYVQINR